MYQKYFLIILLLFFITSCKKKEDIFIAPPDEKKSYELYEKAVVSMNEGEFFFAAKTFSEAESILPVVEHSAKAALMSGYCYYSINFYDEAISSLENFLRKYPTDKNVQYASYLINLSNYKKISRYRLFFGPKI